MTRVIAAIGDLMFRSRVTETAKVLGTEVVFIRDPGGLGPADLLIVDLNAERFRPFEILQASKLRAVAYAGHLQTELLEKARALGAEALTNGQFSARLPELLGP